MRILQRTDRALAALESGILVIALSGMLILSFLQVILRNFFNTSILWGDTLSRHLVLWLCFVGASLATREGKHIKIDALSRALRGRVQIAAQALAHGFGAVACAYLGWAALSLVRLEAEGGAKLILGIPTWVFQVIMPVGFGIMALRFLAASAGEIVRLSSAEGGEA